MSNYSQYNVPEVSQCVNFGVGQPTTSELPLDDFKDVLQSMIQNINDPEFLQYHSIPGYDKLRIKLSLWLTEQYYRELKKNSKIKKLDVSHKIDYNQILMTNGNTGALQLLLNVFCEAGDEIIIENPTYFIAKKFFEEYNLKINTVNMDNDGLNLEELENKIKHIIQISEKYPQNKIFLYTIPVHHNPTSITMSHSKRLKLAELCKKYPNFYIISDEVYHFLNFDNIDVYPLADYHPNILSLGSFSKTLFPAVRVGWIYSNDKSGKILGDIKKSSWLDSSGGLNPLGFKVVEQMITDKKMDTILQNNIKKLSSRCETMTTFLNSHRDKFDFVIPRGGYFLWLKMKYNTKGFFEYCENSGIKFHAGYKFGSNCNNYLRLSFSYYNEKEIIEGLQRLVKLYYDFIRIKVSICGYNGKLGSLIVKELENNPEYSISKIDRKMIIDDYSDVIIDVSSSLGTKELLTKLIQESYNVPIIIGTTGLDDETLSLITIYSEDAPVAVISNFSKGINTVKKMIQSINNNEWKFNMIEKHHTHKKDAPSGTAKTLSSLLNKDCPIQSIREGEIIGYHELHLDNDAEEIIIIHNAKDRSLFAKGCIEYIPWIINKSKGVYYEMDYDINKQTQSINKIDNTNETSDIESIENIIDEKQIKNEKILIPNVFFNIEDEKYKSLIIKENIPKSLWSSVFTDSIKNENTDGVIFLTVDDNDETTYEMRIWIKLNNEFINYDNYNINIISYYIIRYLEKTKNIKEGIILNPNFAQSFIINDDKTIKLYFDDPTDSNIDLNEKMEWMDIFNCILGYNAVNIVKYETNKKELIIHTDKSIDDIDEKLNLIGEIKNSKYHIINYDKNKIQIKSYLIDSDISDSKTNFSLSAYICAFKYLMDYLQKSDIKMTIELNNDMQLDIYNENSDIYVLME